MSRKPKAKAEPWPNFGQWFFVAALTCWFLAALVMVAVGA